MENNQPALDQTEQIEQSEVQTSQNQTQDNVTPYFFHSRQEENPQFRRYSAGGYVSRDENGKPVLVLAYAVCSESEEHFNRKKAILITTGRLRKGEKVHLIPITEEQFAHPSRTLLEVAKYFVPLTAFNRQMQKELFNDMVTEMIKSGIEQDVLPTHPRELLIAVSEDEDPSSHETNQVQAATALGSLMQPGVKQD